ncbi:tripartite tricarboxylate transporter TctB family protein [Ammoniphilus sp. YIM 78166]|uniref:tripartite tricarboxylate transporter TctB family protein n=1 Tax=Ammoniphilus sp. YIM 78166 TaxID=1644106 RepID=UPI00106F8F0F|nr:tripartite tricarboxylate transporter TctB family protein [Ammoniphilus sp. YIM 78166]
MNKTFDRYTGVVLLALGALVIVESQKISTSAYGSNVGPNIFPLFIGIAMILLSGILILETFRYPHKEKQKGSLDYRSFGIIFSAAVLYAFFLEDLGYVISTFLFLLVGFQTMKRERMVSSLIIAGCFSFGVYYLFVEVLQGSLPAFPSWLSL